MILKKSKIIWKVNPRLKTSLKYKKHIFSLEIEVPPYIDLTPENKNIIQNYIHSKMSKKKITSSLRADFTQLFERRIVRKRKSFTGFSHFNLNERMNYLNDLYFDSTCSIKGVHWTVKSSKRILGRYYEDDKTIFISRYLNTKSIPQYIIDYIVFHEMCHHVFPPYFKDGKRKVHHSDFKKNEKRFEKYIEANEWIKNNIK